MVYTLPRMENIAPVPVGDPPPSGTTEIRISVLTVVKIIVLVVGLYLLWRLGDVIVMIFIALLLASLLDPFADWLAKRKIPRAIAVLVIYIVLFGLLSLAIVLIIPPLLTEFSELVRNFATIWQRVGGGLASVRELSAEYGLAENIQRGLLAVEQGLGAAITSALGTLRGFFGGLVSFLLVLVLTFYLVVEENAVKRLFRSVAPVEYQPYLADVLTRMQQKIGRWLRGELVLMFIVGLFSYIGLAILGVDYALILALIAGFAEIIPYAGPIMAAIPAVVLAFTQSPVKALFVLVLYFAIQQLENNLLVPKVMQRAVGLNPIVSIIALLVGARLGGILNPEHAIAGGLLGAVLAIPVATALSVLVQDLFREREKSEAARER